MSDNTLKEFLVKLGFKVDGASERKFTDSVAKATLNMIEYASAATATAGAVVAAVAVISDRLEKLYYQSQRTGAAADNLQGFANVMSQFGTSSTDAAASAQNLGDKLRNIPNFGGMLKQVGVESKDANGNLRDTAEILVDLSKAFAKMDNAHAHAYAQSMGIDENTLLAMKRGSGELEKRIALDKQMNRALGLDLNDAASKSRELMNSLRVLQNFAVKIWMTLASKLQGRFAASLSSFIDFLNAHGPEIARVLDFIATSMAFLVDTIYRLGGRAGEIFGTITDWFNKLTPASKQLIGTFGAILIAWKILNAGFITSPVGMILALSVAILALYDDYKTWKEGGDSLVDWSKWTKEIGYVTDAIESLGYWIGKATDWVGGWQVALDLFLVYLGGRFLFGVLGVLNTLSGGIARAALQGLGGAIASALGGISLVGSAAMLAAAAAGYALGSAMYNAMRGSIMADNIGHAVTKALAFLHIGDAQETLNMEARTAKRKAAQNRADTAFAKANATPKGSKEHTAAVDAFNLATHEISIIDATQPKPKPDSVKSEPKPSLKDLPEKDRIDKTLEVEPNVKVNVKVNVPGPTVNVAPANINIPSANVNVPPANINVQVAAAQKETSIEQKATPQDTKQTERILAETGDRANRALAIFEKLGWTHQQAAGIVANLVHESRLKKNAVGDNGAALGVAQWHKDRQINFAKFVGHDIRDSTDKEQYEFVNHELRDGGEQVAGRALQNATSAAQAGRIMSGYYERPADRLGEMNRRAVTANTLEKTVPPITQTNTITITGVSDPKIAAKEVEHVMDDANSRMTRNMRTAVFQ